VGGALRDVLLGIPVGEIDAAVDGDPEPLARALEGAGRGRAVFLSKDRPGPRVFRLAAGAGELDLAALEGATIEEDLARRDFTVNALALPVGGGPLVDPFGGAADLARRSLRGVRERNFHDDPLRSLRAARLIATLGLSPDATLLAWSRAAAAGLDRVAAERVSAELARLLAAPRAAPALAWSARAGILGAALGSPLSRPRAANLARDAAALDGRSERALPAERRRRLRLAWIAARLGMDGAATRKWLSARRWGRREAEESAALVSLARRASRAPTGDDAWAWILDAGSLAADAARLAALLRPASARGAARLARLARRRRRAVRVSGADVMAWTGIPPGPRIGELLGGLAIAVAAGRIRTRGAARDWLSATTRTG
jgi:tRNA nucleotidyltransferase/poly(A) polymerase